MLNITKHFNMEERFYIKDVYAVKGRIVDAVEVIGTAWERDDYKEINEELAHRIEVTKDLRKEMKHSTDNCWLEHDEHGMLNCTYNHKVGEECLMDAKYNEAF